MDKGSGSAPRRPRPEGGANRRMFASIQSTLRSGKDTRPEATAPLRNAPKRREHTALVLKSVDEVIEQLSDLDRRGEHSIGQIKQNLEASSSTFDEMWDEEWTKLVEVLLKMCLESHEAPFVVDLLPIFMKYTDFVEPFCERMSAMSSEFVLPPEGEVDKSLENVPGFLGALLCARWPRSMHRDTQEANPVLFTAFEIVRGWMLVVEEATGIERKKEPVGNVAALLRDRCNLDDEDEDGEKEEEDTVAGKDTVVEESKEEDEKEDGEEEQFAFSAELLNRCCSALASICETQQRSLWLNRPELVDDMYKCIKLAITHNKEIEGSVKVSLLHTFMLMNEWSRSKAVTTKCAATQTADK